MSAEFWIGTLLSVPIGVGTGLAVPPIQRFFRSRGDAKAIEESQKARHEYLRVLFFLQHPEMLTQYLVEVGIEIAFASLTTVLALSVGLVLGTTSGLITAPSLFRSSVVHHVLTGIGRHHLGAFVLIPLLILVEILFIFYVSFLLRVCLPAITTLRHVRYFKEYVIRVPATIRNLEAEKRLEEQIYMAAEKSF